MRALYLGDSTGTSRHRSEAMRRLGWKVEVIDPRACFRNSRIAEQWIWHAGSFGMESFVRNFVLGRMAERSYDICVVNHGELIGPSLLAALRPCVGAILNYNADNPFVARDHRRWRLFKKAMRMYDLCATPRISTAQEGERLGLRMHRFIQSADEIVHRPRPYSQHDSAKYSSDVAFIGTWFSERGPFVRRLLQSGLSVKVFGANWHNAAEYKEIQQSLVIGEFLGDEEYCKAIQYTKIALGFVSQGNADLHTGRSVEVPALGTLLCAKRTSQHMELYAEDEEAVFWDNLGECAEKCKALIAEPSQLARIAAAGSARQTASQHWNEILLNTLINEALENARRDRRPLT